MRSSLLDTCRESGSLQPAPKQNNTGYHSRRQGAARGCRVRPRVSSVAEHEVAPVPTLLQLKLPNISKVPQLTSVQQSSHSAIIEQQNTTHSALPLHIVQDGQLKLLQHVQLGHAAGINGSHIPAMQAGHKQQHQPQDTHLQQLRKTQQDAQQGLSSNNSNGMISTARRHVLKRVLCERASAMVAAGSCTEAVDLLRQQIWKLRSLHQLEIVTDQLFEANLLQPAVVVALLAQLGKIVTRNARRQQAILQKQHQQCAVEVNRQRQLRRLVRKVEDQQRRNRETLEQQAAEEAAARAAAKAERWGLPGISSGVTSGQSNIGQSSGFAAVAATAVAPASVTLSPHSNAECSGSSSSSSGVSAAAGSTQPQNVPVATATGSSNQALMAKPAVAQSAAAAAAQPANLASQSSPARTSQQQDQHQQQQQLLLLQCKVYMSKATRRLLKRLLGVVKADFSSYSTLQLGILQRWLGKLQVFDEQLISQWQSRAVQQLSHTEPKALVPLLWGTAKAATVQPHTAQPFTAQPDTKGSVKQLAILPNRCSPSVVGVSSSGGVVAGADLALLSDAELEHHQQRQQQGHQQTVSGRTAPTAFKSAAGIQKKSKNGGQQHANQQQGKQQAAASLGSMTAGSQRDQQQQQQQIKYHQQQQQQDAASDLAVHMAHNNTQTTVNASVGQLQLQPQLPVLKHQQPQLQQQQDERQRQQGLLSQQNKQAQQMQVLQQPPKGPHSNNQQHQQQQAQRQPVSADQAASPQVNQRQHHVAAAQKQQQQQQQQLKLKLPPQRAAARQPHQKQQHQQQQQQQQNRHVQQQGHQSLAATAAEAPAFVTSWLTASANNLNTFNASQLASSIYSLALLQHHPPADWLASYFAASKLKMPYSSAQDLSNTLWALGRLQLLPPDAAWWAQFQVASTAVLWQFDGVGIANLFWGAARLQLQPSAELSQLLLWQAQRRFSGMDLQLIASLAWGVSELELKPRLQWLHQLSRRVQSLHSSVAPGLAASILLSFSSLGYCPKSFMRRFLTVLHPQLSAFSPQDIANTFTAFSRMLYVPRDDWLFDFMLVARKAIPQCGSQELLCIANAFAVLSNNTKFRVQPDILAALVAQAQLHVAAFSTEDCVNLVQSLVYLKVAPGVGLLSAIADRFSQQVAAAAPAEVAGMLWTLGAFWRSSSECLWLRRHPSLLQDLLAISQQQLLSHRYSPLELKRVLAAVVAVGCNPGQAWLQAHEAAVVVQLPEMHLSTLELVVGGYRGLGYHGQQGRLLEQVCVQKHEERQKQQIQQQQTLPAQSQHQQ